MHASVQGKQHLRQNVEMLHKGNWLEPAPNLLLGLLGCPQGGGPPALGDRPPPWVGI